MYDVFRYVNDIGGAVEFSYSSGLILTSGTSGLTHNNVDVSTSKGVGQTGETLQSALVETRPINLEGFIQGLSVNGKEKLLDVILPEVPAKFYWNDEYYLSVTPTATPTIEAEDYFARFQFSVLAPYPYWIAKSGESKALFELKPRFKFPFKFTEPYRFAEGMDGNPINIENRGQVKTPFKVTFKASGTVINPKLTNVTTGQFLLLNRTLWANETVTIDITHDLTYVTSNVDGDIRGDLDIDSDFFRLAVGDNFVLPEADMGKAAMQVIVEFASEKAGVPIR